MQFVNKFTVSDGARQFDNRRNILIVNDTSLGLLDIR
jgi:hypothetical protein